MHILIFAAAPQAANAVPGPVHAAIMALLGAAIVVIILKFAGWLLSPKKKKNSRPASGPYGTGRG